MDGDRPRIPRVLATLLALLTLVLALTAPAASADDPPPAARWPAGGSTLRAALAIGAERWGMAPCGGRVAMAWTALDAGINAQSTWANDVDPYLQPSRNSECAIALSTRAQWDWVKLCSVVAHEVGHLTGHDHVDDPTDLMYYAYVQPAPECAATPEPVETGPPPAALAAPRTGPAAKQASASKRAKRKAAKAKRKTANRHAH